MTTKEFLESDPLTYKDIDEVEEMILLFARYFKVHPYTVRTRLTELFKEGI
jgi:hypothetical protein